MPRPGSLLLQERVERVRIPGILECGRGADERGLQTVALASRPADLDATPVALARFVATDDETTAAEAAARLGAHRTLRVEDASVAAVEAWLDGVPRVESRTLRRRVRTALRKIAVVRWVYERMGAR